MGIISPFAHTKRGKKMGEFELLTDSCCDLSYDELDQNKVHYISMMINIDGKEYIDDLRKDFDYQWFIDQLKSEKIPTTSQINIGTYMEIFKVFINQSKPVLYLAFSSGLSGSCHNAMMAVEQLKEEHGADNVPIHVYDSKAASLGEGLLVHHLIQMRDAGATVQEAIEWLDEYSPKLHSWVYVDDLKHLERGGRISKTQAAVGTLMNVKPIIVMNTEGKLESVGKVRGRKKGLAKLVKETVDGIVDPESQEIFIVHADDLDSAEEVKNGLLQSITPKAIKISEMGPTIASHTGVGTVAVFSFGQKR